MLRNIEFILGRVKVAHICYFAKNVILNLFGTPYCLKYVLHFLLFVVQTISYKIFTNKSNYCQMSLFVLPIIILIEYQISYKATMNTLSDNGVQSVVITTIVVISNPTHVVVYSSLSDTVLSMTCRMSDVFYEYCGLLHQ